MADTSVLTQVGEERIVDLYDANAGSEYIGWGTGGGTAVKGDTTLATEVDSRVAATRTQVVADKLQWVGTMTAGAGETITNVGILTATPTGGILLAHSSFTGVALNSGDQISFTIQMEIT